MTRDRRPMAIPLPDAHRRELLELAVQVAVETVGFVLAFVGLIVFWLLIASIVSPSGAFGLGPVG